MAVSVGRGRARGWGWNSQAVLLPARSAELRRADIL